MNTRKDSVSCVLDPMLLDYSKKLTAAQVANPNSARLPNPEGTCKTLWIPFSVSNRTASINLNHNMLGFDGDGLLVGQNGNCGTGYNIIRIPDNWGSDQIEHLASVVHERLGKTYREKYRVLCAKFDRVQFIMGVVKELAGQNF